MPGCRTDQRIAIRRIGDRSIDDRLDAHRSQDREALAGGFDVLLQAAQIITEQLVGKLGRDPLEPVRRGLPLVGPKDQTLPLLPEVVADIRIPDQRQPRTATSHQLRNIFGDQILMRERDDRQVVTDQRRHFPATVTGGVDYGLSANAAFVGDHQPFARGQALKRDDPGAAMDLRAGIARALGERLRELCRIDITIARIIEASAQSLGAEERMTRSNLFRLEQFKGEALGMGLGDHMAEFIDAILRVRQADAAGDVVIDLVAHFLGQPRVQLGAVMLQLDQVPGGGEVRTVARRVPG